MNSEKKDLLGIDKQIESILNIINTSKVNETIAITAQYGGGKTFLLRLQKKPKKK